METDEIVICKCYSNRHHIIIRKDDEDIYVTIHLNNFSFFKRIVYAVKYIFGYTTEYGQYEEIILNDKDYSKFEDISKIMKDRYEVTSK